MGRAVLLLLVLVLVLPRGTAHAQAIVRVRAETRIELEVDRGGEQVRIRGTLRDDRGDPLPGRVVEISVVDERGISRGRVRENTNDRGELRADFPLEPGSYFVDASYAGDDRYSGVRVDPQLLDLARAHVRLTMNAVDGRLDRLDLDRAAHMFRVRASSPEGGQGLSVVLLNELHTELAAGETDAEGEVLFEIPSETLGPAAAGRLVVRTAGDTRRGPAQTEVLVVRFRTTELQMEANRSHVVAGGPLHLSGTLTTSEGPLPRKAVGLFAGDRHLETVLTDNEGRFERDVELAENSGTVDVQARFESDAPWRPEARSEPLTIRIEAPGGTPLPYLLGIIVTCALGIFLLSLRGRRARKKEAGERESHLPAPPGVVVGRPRGRDASRTDVGGLVLDADEGTPLPHARVRLEQEETSLTLTADASGRFHVAAVPAGRWQLDASCDGYESRTATLRVPHRGEHAGLEVRLRSLRQLALRRYRPLAERLAPTQRWWAFWTPRELADRAHRSARIEVRSVTEALERAAYAAPAPQTTDVEAIGERADRLVGELRDVEER